MGDNRDNSSDSRRHGEIDFDDVKGKAQIVIWSWYKALDPKERSDQLTPIGWLRTYRFGHMLR